MRHGQPDPSPVVFLRNAAFYRYAATHAATVGARRDAIARHGYFLARARALNQVRESLRRRS